MSLTFDSPITLRIPENLLRKEPHRFHTCKKRHRKRLILRVLHSRAMVVGPKQLNTSIFFVVIHTLLSCR